MLVPTELPAQVVPASVPGEAPPRPGRSLRAAACGWDHDHVADQPRRGRRWSPAEAVADQLRRRILSGEVADGGLLPKIDDLMTEFGVSRPAVRSACAILETEGLLRVRRGHQGGAVVHAPGPANAAYTVAQVLEARRVQVPDVAAAVERLEPLCAQLCAERPDREQAVLPALESAQRDLAAAIGQTDGIAAAEAARRWHEALADGCGNETTRVLLGALEMLWTSHSRVSTTDSVARGVPYSEEQSRLVYEGHAAIAELIAAGDATAAAAAVRNHLRTARIHGQPTDAPATGAVRAELVRDSLSGWPGG
jgi:GntR family transcriptional repressor for pyruvate dehydrogenase complex